jgi:putative transposase
MIDPVTGETIDQKEPAEQLLAQAKEQGVSLVGPRWAAETAHEECAGSRADRAPRARAWPDTDRSQHEQRHQALLTEIGPVEIEVPGDRDGSFEPVIVPKRRRRLDGIDQVVLSLSARG